jgi:hypothetical protein
MPAFDSYNRNISKKLISLQLLLAVLLTGALVSFHYQKSNLGYFLAVSLIFLSLIVLKDFRVTNDAVQVKKYFAFGILPLTWTFNQYEIRYEMYGSGFDGIPDQTYDDDSGTGLGCLFMIYSMVFPGKISKVNFTIFNTAKNGFFKSVNILLNKREYDKLFEFVHRS